MLSMRAPTHEWKLIYRTLQAHLMEHPELLEAEVICSLQTELQALARQEGVDVTDHAAWDAWLGNEAVSCAERMASRHDN